MSWNFLCRAVPFNVFTREQFQTTASLSIHQEQEKLLKDFPPYTCSSKPCSKFSSRANFSVIISYRLSNFPLPRFLAYLTRTVLSVYSRNFSSFPYGIYFLGEPVLVRLAVLIIISVFYRRRPIQHSWFTMGRLFTEQKLELTKRKKIEEK